MKRGKTIITILLAVLVVAGNAQYIGFSEIDKSKVMPWNAVVNSEYSGVYHFGDSESESSLMLIMADTIIVGQIKSGYFDVDGKWYWDYKTVTNIKIEGNKFRSDLANGEFVKAEYEDKEVIGLKIYKPWSTNVPTGKTEIGLWSHKITEHLSGKYPQASYKLLTDADLKGIKKTDLKIMRNEIYARYGYKFKVGGDMDEYFKKQDWYSREFDNVDAFLTEIELKNLGLIKTAELK